MINLKVLQVLGSNYASRVLEVNKGESLQFARQGFYSTFYINRVITKVSDCGTILLVCIVNVKVTCCS